MVWTDFDRAYWKMRFDRLERAVLQQGGTIMATVEQLNAAVADLTTAVDSAIAALSTATGIPPEQLDAAVAKIQEQTGKLNDAVHAHGM